MLYHDMASLQSLICESDSRDQLRIRRGNPKERGRLLVFVPNFAGEKKLLLFGKMSPVKLEMGQFNISDVIEVGQNEA